MSGQRSGVRLLRFGTAAAAATVYALRVRPRLLTWGATRDEAARAYPGDELVPDAGGSSTMATTLPAPPERVWAWLVQMGADRGGWYSWDRLDHYGEPSTDRIVAEWQSLRVGQRVSASRNGQTWFTVAMLEPNRTLVLRSDLVLPSGRSFNAGSTPLPLAYLNGIWAFHLRPTPGEQTRLVVRTRGRSRPRRLTRPFDLLVGEPAHVTMQLRQFQNLRSRVIT
ncbi:hypothetical protein ABZ863_12945 [Saccharomonospora sp. NPDC046836]|uniref:hypothetical protein n=1 Tax=Saccharomonospora sp. NPDC046836 TaxID=3156921 RepID=UPI00340DF64A